MKVNGVEITADTVLATRKHFADIHRACIDDAKSGKTRVNDLVNYVVSEENRIAYGMTGAYDHTITFIQAALWIQTGECVAIL